MPPPHYPSQQSQSQTQTHGPPRPPAVPPYPHLPLTRGDFNVLFSLWPHHFDGQILSEYDPRLQVRGYWGSELSCRWKRIAACHCCPRMASTTHINPPATNQPTNRMWRISAASWRRRRASPSSRPARAPSSPTRGRHWS